jgi:hypothetical protein|tara:strand:- start:1472 stop:1693 length:222 start_codon:yes stop_codon:yes gene_type:complete
MSYLKHLKKIKMPNSTRWVIKYDKNNDIKNIRLVSCPKEYKKNKEEKTLHTQRAVIKILEKQKRKFDNIKWML